MLSACQRSHARYLWAFPSKCLLCPTRPTPGVHLWETWHVATTCCGPKSAATWAPEGLIFSTTFRSPDPPAQGPTDTHRAAQDVQLDPPRTAKSKPRSPRLDVGARAFGPTQEGFSQKRWWKAMDVPRDLWGKTMKIHKKTRFSWYQDIDP